MEEQITKRHYRREIDKWRFFLTIFAGLYSYGIVIFKYYGQILLGFAIPALFIISGFLVLKKSKNRSKRILRAIKRTGICFFVLLVVNIILSAIVDFSATMNLVTNYKFWIKFLALNYCELPIGDSLWYVQALFYAYIIIFVLDKLTLLRFDWALAIIFLFITMYTGELSKLLGFNIKGYEFIIPGNFLTRALPYTLIGCYIHRRLNFFRKLPSWIYAVSFVCGVGLVLAEDLALRTYGYDVYHGHYIGMAVMAVSLCIPVFLSEAAGFEADIVQDFAKFSPKIMYYVYSPVYYIAFVLLQKGNSFLQDIFNEITGSVTVVVALLIAVICFFIKLKIDEQRHRRKRRKHRHSHSSANKA